MVVVGGVDVVIGDVTNVVAVDCAILHDTTSIVVINNAVIKNGDNSLVISTYASRRLALWSG